MPKMKTHRGAAKRFRTTGSGKLVRRQAGVSHLLEAKTGTRRRRLQREADVAPADAPSVRKMLGD
ncbi:MAG: 50S ribosomal protein L35 [Actinomycetota bacterium]